MQTRQKWHYKPISGYVLRYYSYNITELLLKLQLFIAHPYWTRGSFVICSIRHVKQEPQMDFQRISDFG